MSRADSKPSLVARSFYERSPEIVARALLGKILLVHHNGERLSGRITEAEAYLGLADAASHAFPGRSKFNDVLFGPAGRSDVFLIYGMYYCFNVSCHPDGVPGGVLIRALDPMEGMGTMAKLRGVPRGSSAKVLTGGPGRLCKALGITRATHHDVDVTRRGSIVQVLDDGFRPETIDVTPRIGIRKAADLPLRFVVGKPPSK